MGCRLIRHPLYSVVFTAFVFFVAMPVFYTVATALFSNEMLSGEAGLLNAGIMFLLLKSSAIAFGVALLSTVSGTILGFILYKTKIPLRGFFRIILLIPLFISPYILAVAWKDLFFFVFGQTEPIASAAGVIIVLTTVFTPLSMLITGSALSNINPQMEEAGLLIIPSGGVIRKITLPLIKPAVITSFVLVFIFSISEFSVPAFFGVEVLTTEIFTEFSAFYNHTLAVLQSVLLILVCILLLLAEKKYIADAPFISIGGRGTGRKFYLRNKHHALGTLWLWGWLLISIILPFTILFVQSLQNGTSHFIRAFHLLAPTFANSAVLAFSGALLVVFTGFVVASFSETEKRMSPIWLLLIIFAIPSTVFGISLIKFYNRPALDFIYSGYAIILIGYTGKFSFISAKLIGNAIRRIPASLDEAAALEGISRYRRTQKILIPLIAPSLFAAFIVSFIFCLGEMGTTIMVYPPGTEIMPIKIFTVTANASQALTSSLTLIVFSVTLLMITLFYFAAKPLFNRKTIVDD